MFLKAILQSVPGDFQTNIKLKSVCEEHSKTNQDFHSLSSTEVEETNGYVLPRFHRFAETTDMFYLLILDGQIECYGTAIAFLPELVISEEPEEDVDQSDTGHALIEDSADSEEVRGRLHIVLQRHHLK